MEIDAGEERVVIRDTCASSGVGPVVPEPRSPGAGDTPPPGVPVMPSESGPGMPTQMATHV